MYINIHLPHRLYRYRLKYVGLLIYGDAEAAIPKERCTCRINLNWNLFLVIQHSPVAVEVDCGISEYRYNEANCRTLVAVNAQQAGLLHARRGILVAITGANSGTTCILSLCITFKVLSTDGGIPRQSL